MHPDGDGNLDESLQMMRLIRRLATKAAREALTEDDMELLVGTEDTYYAETLLHCDAVEAPLIEDNPDWESQVVDEYASSDSVLDLEDYLDIRRRDPDCERCPFTSPYNLHPMDPCEYSAGALEQVLTDPDLIARLAQPMKPAVMHALANDLESALSQGAWNAMPTMDSEDYVNKAVLFLRFWADQGFGVLPTDVDRVIGFGPDNADPNLDDGAHLLH